MFQFKQFKINQDQCAMKVCTDSCIMGAYTDIADAKTVLDIGTGTGLLTLMLAQRSKALFTAIEMDEQAIKQAAENIHESPWEDRINLYHQDINQFAVTSEVQFDHIICNPPFYSNSLKSPDAQKNKAHHGVSLTQEQLLFCINKLLHQQGKFTLLLPVAEAVGFQYKAEIQGYYLIDSLEIAHNSNKKPFRRIDTYEAAVSIKPETKKLVIKDCQNNYTENFQSLLKEYYLPF